MKRLALLVFLPCMLLSARAEAYVTYNRLGYVSCSACHSLPTGGGLLSTYGQSVQGAMASFSKELEPADTKITQGVSAHVIALDSTNGANPFLMEANYLATATLSQSVRADVAVGPSFRQGAPGNYIAIPGGWDAFVLRRLVFTKDLNETSSLQIGRDGPVAGLNIGDHTAFLRARNRRGVYDYPTQLRYIYQSETLQLLPYLNAPTFEESANNHEYGAGIRSEYLLSNSSSIGAQAYYGNTSAVSRGAFSGFFRLSGAHWNGLQGEYVFTTMNTHASGDTFGQHTLYVKPYIAIPEWIETGFVYEFLQVGAPFAETASQFGPEVNVRINQYVSILGDGRNMITSGNSGWSWYGQLYFHYQI